MAYNSAISIHALREEGDRGNSRQYAKPTISIHALREEGDPASVAFAVAVSLFLSTPSARRATGFGAQTPSGGYDFYPRPPRGGRLSPEPQRYRSLRFLSTPSARRATELPRADDGRRAISIHALREEGDGIFGIKAELAVVISIHALREEGDDYLLSVGVSLLYFYPRPPRGGRRDCSF